MGSGFSLHAQGKKAASTLSMHGYWPHGLFYPNVTHVPDAFIYSWKDVPTEAQESLDMQNHLSTEDRGLEIFDK